MSLSIYILRLQGGKYYVGKTMNVAKRYQEHVNGQGAQWTRLYKPISVEQTIPNASPFDEDKMVKECMAKYGIENVRGGSYVQEELSEFHMDALNMEIWAAQDKCTQCGRKGHFVKDCFANTDVTNKKIKYEESDKDENSNEEEWECDYCDRTFTTKFGCNVHEKSCKEKNTNVVRSIKKEITSKLPFSPVRTVTNTEPNKPFSPLGFIKTEFQKPIDLNTLAIPDTTGFQKPIDLNTLAIPDTTGFQKPIDLNTLAIPDTKKAVKTIWYPVQNKIQFQSSPESLNSTEYEVLPISQQPSKISASHLHSLAIGRHKRDVEEKVRQILNMIYEQASLKLRWITFVIPPELEKKVLEQLRAQFDTSVTFTNKGQLKTSDMRYWWMKYEVSWI